MAAEVALHFKGQDDTGAAFASVEGRLQKMQKGFANLGGAIQAAVGTLAIRSLARFATAQIEAVDAVGELADQTGLAAEQMQKLQGAFSMLTQATNQQVTKALTTFNEKLGEARKGNEKLQETFKRLGVDITQNANVAIEQAFTGLATYTDKAKEASDAAEVFGSRVGPKLAGALDGTTAALDAARASVTEVFTEEDIARASRLNDQIEKIKRQMGKDFAEAMLDNAAAIEDVATAMGKVAGWAASSLTAVTEWVKRLAVGAARLSLGEPVVQDEGVVASGQSRGAIDRSATTPAPPPNIVEESPEAVSKRQRAHEKEIAAAKRAAEITAKNNEDIVQTVAKNTEREADEWRKKQADDEEALQKYIADVDIEALQRIREEREQFGQMFVDNLVQASDAGFKAVLASWARTLEQMVLKAAAMKIWEAVFPQGTQGSGWFGSIKKAFGFAQGGSFVVGGSGGPDSQMIPLRLSPGERVSVQSRSAQALGAGGITIVQNVDASGSDPALVARAMRLAEQSALARFKDLQRRGRG